MKSIGYAYATSDYAKQFGFYANGCWFVTFAPAKKNRSNKRTNVKLKIEGFASYADAFEFAETLSEEYESFSSNIYHAKNNFVNAPKEVREFHLGEKS